MDLYNDWFILSAPEAFREIRERIRRDVLHSLDITDNFRSITEQVLRENPTILPVLRMSTSPPLAVDRLVGLSRVSKNLVARMEAGKLPFRIDSGALKDGLASIVEAIIRMIDLDLFPWLAGIENPSELERLRAASVVADRLSHAVGNPVIRNRQEERQLNVAAHWLEEHGYAKRHPIKGEPLEAMEPGTYAYRVNVISGPEAAAVNIPVDLVIQPFQPRASGLPVLIEAKSAGDFTNVNKRQKEEADKIRHLRSRYGDSTEYLLLLGGYFNTRYLEYEARAGIDWIWEHRIEDLEALGLIDERH